MSSMRGFGPALALAGALSLSVVAVACDDDPAFAPGGSDGAFVRDITFGELETALETGVVRLEVELAPGGPPLVIREAKIENEEPGEEEEIESRAIAPGVTDAAAPPDCGGTLTLAPEGLAVGFDAATEFEGDASCEEFIAFVEGALADGIEPKIEAERPGPAEPQAPDVPDFQATELEFDPDDVGDADGEVELELDVDADNLVGCDEVPDAPAGCLGVLRILDLDLLIVDGVTELEEEDDEVEGAEEFEGLVASVDLDLGTFALDDGRTFRVVEGRTRFEGDEDGDDEEHLGSLEEVAAALDVPVPVEAEGEAVDDPENPSVPIVVEVEFEVEDDS